MSAATEPGLPQDPADFSRRPRLRLWTAPVFVLAGVAAGIGLAISIPGLLPKAPAPVVQPVPAVAPVAAAPAAQPLPPVVISDGEVDRLNAKIEALETQGQRHTTAVSAALAAATLIEASQSSRPFAGQLGAMRQANPDLPELAALASVAEMGAPSRQALAASFAPYAARAAVASRAPSQDSKLDARVVYLISRLVAVRRLNDTTSTAPDAALARAEAALADGDVAGALQALSALPPKAHAAVAPWTAMAERRALVDRQIAALRRRAAEGVADVASGTAPSEVKP